MARRREVLKALSMGAAKAVMPDSHPMTAAMTGLASSAKAAPAGDRVRLGVIGTGGRGCYVAPLFAERPDVEIAVLCDVHPERLQRGVHAVRKVTGKAPKTVTDYRQLLDDKENPR